MTRLASKVLRIVLLRDWVTDGLLISDFQNPPSRCFRHIQVHGRGKYIERRYEDIDPVVGLARSSQRSFSMGSSDAATAIDVSTAFFLRGR